MSDRVTERLVPTREQINRSKNVASQHKGVKPNWQQVMREAIDRGLSDLERELKLKGR